MTRSVDAIEVDAALLKRWPLPDPEASRSKEDRGRVLVVAGSPDVPGAAVLAGEAALRAGAGKLQIAVPAVVATAIAIAVPEAKVLSLPSDENGACQFTQELEHEAQNADAVLVGAGMEDSPALRRMVVRLGAVARRAMVVDAGAIAAFEALPRSSLTPVLTPHAGEMASLLGKDLEEISARPAEIALEFAARAGVIVVLKAATTRIATPDGRLFVHAGGCPGLGTSGSGDVLAGILTGLSARGAAADQAAVWAVYLHGLAGRRLSDEVGKVGFLARQLSPLIPGLMGSI